MDLANYVDIRSAENHLQTFPNGKCCLLIELRKQSWEGGHLTGYKFEQQSSKLLPVAVSKVPAPEIWVDFQVASEKDSHHHYCDHRPTIQHSPISSHQLTHKTTIPFRCQLLSRSIHPSIYLFLKFHRLRHTASQLQIIAQYRQPTLIACVS